MKKTLIFVCIFFLAIMPALAKEGRMKLLATSEIEGGAMIGSSADVMLEINSGSGRVFIETFPLTRLDTQISTRFAKEVACDFIDFDCSAYDFIYTIRSDSAIIGGPSAGSALTLLTVMTLEDTPVSQEIAITGTINSGGVIGPVAGLKEKLEAARQSGIKKVLIPKGTSSYKDNSNNTVQLYNVSRQLGITLIEVSDIEEALYEFGAREVKSSSAPLEIDEKYQETMDALNVELCERADELIDRVSLVNFSVDSGQAQKYAFALNRTKKAEEARDAGRYYTSASYCFGANIALTQLDLEMRNLSAEEKADLTRSIREEFAEFSSNISRFPIRTMTDLQGAMAVRERIEEAGGYLNLSSLALRENSSVDISYIGAAIERYNSARSWSTFLGGEGKVFIFDTKVLGDSCNQKLAEATERFQYLKLTVPLDVESVALDLEKASRYRISEQYEMCLYLASKAKAGANAILSTRGLTEETFEEFMQSKLALIQKNLAREIKKGVFPILGYSYWEYAQDLRESDRYSALLFSEYALEFSNLDLYFEGKNAGADLKEEWTTQQRLIVFYGVVLLVGILIGIVATREYHRKRVEKIKKKVEERAMGRKRS